MAEYQALQGILGSTTRSEEEAEQLVEAFREVRGTRKAPVAIDPSPV